MCTSHHWLIPSPDRAPKGDLMSCCRDCEATKAFGRGANLTWNDKLQPPHTTVALPHHRYTLADERTR